MVPLNSPCALREFLTWRYFGKATEDDRAAFPLQVQNPSLRLRDDSDGLVAPSLSGKYEIRIYTGGSAYRIVDRRLLIVEADR